ncbi:MAG: citryl-CoA lyase [bacterium]|nr:citryl-CoA lyase [bacterium]
MSEKTWKTAITTSKDGVPQIKGYKLTDLLQKVTFTRAIFLILTGELPEPKQEKMLNAVLVASIDHGVEAPSTTVARITVGDGVPLANAVAAGIGAIGKYHGGAVEAAAKLFQEAVKNNESADSIVKQAKEESRRLPGFGHKVYEVDPRTAAILEVSQEIGFGGPHTELATKIEEELNQVSSKKLPLNIDGITAAVLSDLGLPWQLGNGFFVIARTVGLVAHVHEELTAEKPVSHRLSEEDVLYNGPESRQLPK